MGKLNLSALKTKQAELKKGNGGNDYGFDKLEAGKNVRRILPPKGEKDMFYSEGYQHFGLGADGKKVVTCLSTYGKKCPVCEYLDSIKNSSNKEDKEFSKNARKSRRIFINVLNRDSDEDEEKVKVLPIGVTILKQVIDIICDPDYGDITDFEEGRDITITKSGKGMNTEYSVLAKPKESIASTQFSAEELDTIMPDLDSLFTEKSYEEIKAILNGEEAEEDEERPAKRKEKTEDYEEEETETEDDEDEEPLDYAELELDDLKELCEDRGIDLPKRVTKSKLVMLLEEDDESDEYEMAEDEGEEEDDLMASVKNAVKKKRASRNN